MTPSDDMAALTATLDAIPVEAPTLSGAAGKRCRRHEWVRIGTFVSGNAARNGQVAYQCHRCGAIRDETRARRGKQSRNYGNRAELTAARKYGGQKVGHAGGPVDIRGEDFDTQSRTKRRPPPAEWVKAINAMRDGTRIPRILLRFVQVGHPPDDWFVFKASDFLDWFGRDGTDAPEAP